MNNKYDSIRASSSSLCAAVEKRLLESIQFSFRIVSRKSSMFSDCLWNYWYSVNHYSDNRLRV
jgi:hypothetical protein